jgi:hypothetical protein
MHLRDKVTLHEIASHLVEIVATQLTVGLLMATSGIGRKFKALV